MVDFIKLVLEEENIQFDEKKANQLSPLVLAYIGDAVYEVFIRLTVIMKEKKKVRELHTSTSSLVNSNKQAETLCYIDGFLSDNEKAIVKKGRNAKSTPPKNADVQKYRLSTGFEALIGFLYISQDNKRLNEILKLISENL